MLLISIRWARKCKGTFTRSHSSWLGPPQQGIHGWSAANVQGQFHWVIHGENNKNEAHGGKWQLMKWANDSWQQVLAPFFAHYDLNGCNPRAASFRCFVGKSTNMRWQCNRLWRVQDDLQGPKVLVWVWWQSWINTGCNVVNLVYILNTFSMASHWVNGVRFWLIGSWH